MIKRRKRKKRKLSKRASNYISRKIRKLYHEGYPLKQATAISYSKARKAGFRIKRYVRKHYG